MDWCLSAYDCKFSWMESDVKPILFYRWAIACLNILILSNQLDSLFKEYSYVKHRLTNEAGLSSRR